MVAWAFSLAASTFFPLTLLGIFWKRANAAGAIAGMVGGLIVCIASMAANYVDPRVNILGLTHLASGILGMVVNFALQIGVSLVTAPPPQEIQRMADNLRNPVGEMSYGGELIKEPVPAPAPAHWSRPPDTEREHGPASVGPFSIGMS